MENNLVFVYGSLKEGFSNYQYNLSESTKIGSGETVETYGMKDLGAFPGVVLEIDLSTIKGELFKVSDDVFKDNLDMLEGYPHFYDRTQVKVKVEDSIFTAWMYHLADPNNWGDQYVLDGNWVESSYEKSEYIMDPAPKVNSYVIGGRNENS